MIKCDVLVTGAAGFIGQYLCEHLISLGLRVVGIDKKVSATPFELVQHDLTEPFPTQVEAEVCVHLASSVGGIIYNNAAKADMVAYNTAINKGTAELLHKGGCRRMVFFSSINVFESNPVFEHGPLRIPPKLTSYAISKADGEQLLSKTFDNFMVIRPTNVFGRRQTRTHDKVGESHVIPDLMKKIQEHEVVTVLGDGSQRRNFIHVQDVVEFVARNLYLDGKHYFNLRSDLTISISELARELATFMKRDVSFVFDPSFMKLETLSIRDFDLTPVQKYVWAPRFQSIKSGLIV